MLCQTGCYCQQSAQSTSVISKEWRAAGVGVPDLELLVDGSLQTEKGLISSLAHEVCEEHLQKKEKSYTCQEVLVM